MVERQLEQNGAKNYSYQIIFGTEDVPCSDTHLNMIIQSQGSHVSFAAKLSLSNKPKDGAYCGKKKNAETRIEN